MNYLPLFSELKNRPVLVIGGGVVALRKVELLVDAGAKIRLVAKELHIELQELLSQQKIDWVAKTLLGEELEKAIQQVFFVIATTDDSAENQNIATIAEQNFTFCNVVDNQPLCSVIMPSIIDRGDLQVAVSTAGKAPVLARLWREKLESMIPQHIGSMTAIAGEFREQVKAHYSNITQRRRYWERVFNSQRFSQLCESKQYGAAKQFLEDELQGDVLEKGEVTLVGAGPGDPELLTIKGLRFLQQADVVLYDALVSDEIINLVRRDAEKVFVGKRASAHHKKQHEINELILFYARQGKRVVRLKGGDPFVFGRGGEELETLIEEQIPFSVIPGITAAVGATAYAGIPITHRDYAQSATFITGHSKQNGESIEWQTLAMSHHTLVIYMGSLRAAEISQQLIQHGRDADTPVAIISNGTKAEQEVRVGKLKQLAELSVDAPKPALIVIGEVVALQHKLTWFKENN